MDNALDLKPCPFCGYPATQVGDGVLGQLAHCSNEKCPIRNIMFYWAHWNIRPLDGSAAAPPSAGRSNALSPSQVQALRVGLAALKEVSSAYDCTTRPKCPGCVGWDAANRIDEEFEAILRLPEPTTEDPQ